MELSFTEGDEVMYSGYGFFPAGPAVVTDVRVEGDHTEPMYAVRLRGVCGDLLVSQHDLTSMSPGVTSANAVD